MTRSIVAYLATLALFGGGWLYVLGVVTLRDRFLDALSDEQRSYNQHRTRWGYAYFAGCVLSWVLFGVSWFVLRK